LKLKPPAPVPGVVGTGAPNMEGCVDAGAPNPEEVAPNIPPEPGGVGTFDAGAVAPNPPNPVVAADTAEAAAPKGLEGG
jgi:hypothetical protein